MVGTAVAATSDFRTERTGRFTTTIAPMTVRFAVVCATGPGIAVEGGDGDGPGGGFGFRYFSTGNLLTTFRSKFALSAARLRDAVVVAW